MGRERTTKPQRRAGVRAHEELARLARELGEAREQQAATSEVLKIISSSPGELAPVFETILANATRLCEAKFGVLSLYDANGFRIVATHNVPHAYAEFLRSAPAPHPGSANARVRVAQTKQVVQMADARADEAYAVREPLRVAAVELGGARSLVVVPMLKHIQLVGVIAIYRQEVRPFTEKHIELVSNFADQAVIAIENVRLFNEIQERSRQLAEANQHKSRFLAAASHDLRQPMHALGLFVAQLRNHMTSAEGSQLVDRIDDSVTGMNELFNALLDITKLDAGALTPTNAEFPIAELLGRIGSTFAPVAQEKGLLLLLAPSSAWVRSDPVLLERIVLNLVSNALRYTNAGGIVVGCRHRGAKLRIEVWDTGPGIPLEQHRKIFSEFYRLADPAKTNQAGLGLGLAIVDRLCTLLDHPIELTSTLGKGSRFAVTVPTAAARITAQPKIEPPSQATFDAARDKLVVVIDNDTRVLEAMGGLLRNWGCRVIVASTPEAAMAGVSDIGAGARPDLIISDYHLADEQTGITAIAKLREAYGAIPAFVMSGDTAPERLREARESDHQLLHKPVQPITLRAMVNRLLKSGHRL
jgi:signal transduction histidine kinase/CheY-like chemotaxis protein